MQKSGHNSNKKADELAFFLRFFMYFNYLSELRKKYLCKHIDFQCKHQPEYCIRGMAKVCPEFCIIL